MENRQEVTENVQLRIQELDEAKRLKLEKISFVLTPELLKEFRDDIPGNIPDQIAEFYTKTLGNFVRQGQPIIVIGADSENPKIYHRQLAAYHGLMEPDDAGIIEGTAKLEVTATSGSSSLGISKDNPNRDETNRIISEMLRKAS